MDIKFIVIILTTYLILFNNLHSHEITPAVADLTISDKSVKVKIKLNLEAILADLDLTSIKNTDDSKNSAKYSELRALNIQELSTLFEKEWSDFASKIFLKTDTQRLSLTLLDFNTVTTVDRSLSRDSSIVLSAVIPSSAKYLTFSWDSTYGDLVLREISQLKFPYTGYLINGAETEPIPINTSFEQPVLSVALNFIKVGVVHILPYGLDHILFILGLFFVARRFKSLLLQVSVFTLAHTLTLALAILNVVVIPSTIVEPLIALSIAFIAVENLFIDRVKKSRIFIVFVFGLLHGLGFASVLNNIGMNADYFVLSLIAFNIGVELGQLIVLVLGYGLVGFWFQDKPWYRSKIVMPISGIIAIVGIYWFFERLFF